MRAPIRAKSLLGVVEAELFSTSLGLLARSPLPAYVGAISAARAPHSTPARSMDVSAKNPGHAGQKVSDTVPTPPPGLHVCRAYTQTHSRLTRAPRLPHACRPTHSH